MLNTDRFEEFISQYPIYEYRLVDTAEIEVRERVRIICKQECERYGTTWACPPAVGSLEENPQLSKWNSFFQCGRGF